MISEDTEATTKSRTRNLIVVKRTHVTDRQYWPRTDRDLIEGRYSVYYDPARVSLSDRNPAEFGPVGKRLFEQLQRAVGVERFSIDKHNLDVGLRPGYRWEEVEPAVFDLLKKVLRWEDAELIRYADWVAEFGEEEADRIADDLEAEMEEDRPSDKDRIKADGIVIERDNSRTVTYWPPLRIASDSAVFGRPLTDDDNSKLSKLGDQAVELVRQLLKIDGVVMVDIDPYSIAITTSPAFSSKRIHGRVLRAIKRIYSLKEES